MEHFGTRLRHFRDGRGWSQERLGFELNVSKATISKWETGRAEPNLRHLIDIRDLFATDGLTLDHLIYGDKCLYDKAPPNTTESSRANLTSKSEEAYLLKRFRGLSTTRRRGLLDFIAD